MDSRLSSTPVFLNCSALLLRINMNLKLRHLWCALLLALVATGAQASRALRRVENDLGSSSQTGMETLLDGLHTVFGIVEDVYTRVHGYIEDQGRPQEGRKNPPDRGHLWALLIAGSAGFGNYRHQADVAHVRVELYRRVYEV